MAFPFIPAVVEALGGAAGEGLAALAGTSAAEGATAAGTAAATTAGTTAGTAAGTASRFGTFAQAAQRATVNHIASSVGGHVQDVLSDSNTQARNPAE